MIRIWHIRQSPPGYGFAGILESASNSRLCSNLRSETTIKKEEISLDTFSELVYI